VGRAPWQAPAWAGYVTSYVRAKLREAVIGYEEAVVAFATDGVFCRGADLPVAQGNGLGQWKVHKGYSGLVLGAGLYRLDDGLEPRLSERARKSAEHIKEGQRGGGLNWPGVLRGLNAHGYAVVYDNVFVSPLLAVLMPNAFGPHRGRFMRRKRVLAPWADAKVKRLYHYLSIKDWGRDWCDSTILDGRMEESSPFESGWTVASLELLLQSEDSVS